MITESPSPASEDAVAPIQKDGRLITSGRIKDVRSASSLYQNMWQADYIGMYNRSLIDSMFDGGPPKLISNQIAQGGSRETNINWGDGETLLHEACAPERDLIFTPEVIGSTPLKAA